ncbi:methyltransferase domain-containing protein [Taibaiella lutea]|uniref:Methyltransferase domain-containing protein n=1 Tax=Taibaiella lutea TaxID=2608001 RepID=A0A5M6CNJ6_9BACT|nr:methyltransferase [Taibaiella lutea]KAA5534855.1 methyltransferase domain-containing protein [Taibaiella lutea]
MTEKTTAKKPLFEEDKLSALEALDRAQFIAFAPYVWEASKILRDKGILHLIEAARETGITIEEICNKVNISQYGVRILLEAGLGIQLLYRKEGKYFLAKTGHFLLNHEMTKVNFDFMRDVCVEGAPTMEQSIETGKPTGLKTLGNWNTLYEGLSSFPSPAKESWLSFDHFYSDKAFPEALEIVFTNPPKKMLDIGGNTGRWTLECLQFNPDIEMGIVDLKGQLEMAEENMIAAGFQDRVQYHEVNMLDNSKSLPAGYDAIWMSQFLDCFSDEEIVSILGKCYAVSDENTRIFINETFWDRQRFATSAFSLQMTSLYFTNIANGNSQMYDSKVFLALIEKAGFDVIQQHDMVGVSHTILELRKII